MDSKNTGVYVLGLNTHASPNCRPHRHTTEIRNCDTIRAIIQSYEANASMIRNVSFHVHHMSDGAHLHFIGSFWKRDSKLLLSKSLLLWQKLVLRRRDGLRARTPAGALAYAPVIGAPSQRRPARLRRHLPQHLAPSEPTWGGKKMMSG